MDYIWDEFPKPESDDISRHQSSFALVNLSAKKVGKKEKNLECICLGINISCHFLPWTALRM